MFACDCLVLGFTGSGTILGVDQLHGVVVDCEGFLVTIRTDDGQRVVFGGLPSDEVRASFLNSLDDELSGVPIASQYPDIFEEVTGLPPHRKIEFHIDLVKDARPIGYSNATSSYGTKGAARAWGVSKRSFEDGIYQKKCL